VIEFINAREDADRIRFLSKFGLFDPKIRRDPGSFSRPRPRMSQQAREIVRPEDRSGNAVFAGSFEERVKEYRESEHYKEYVKYYKENPGEPYKRFSEYQKGYRENLDSINHLDQAQLLAEINKSFESGPPNLQPWLDLATEKGTPRMLLRCKSLGDFMHMETVTAAVQGAKLATCEHCGAAFLTGPLTGRRSHAKYCSARCRVAAMRARNAALLSVTAASD
jgi:hypothetical protein